MKLACRIQQSRHGVYYYRRQFSIAGIRKECRISLQTKNPTIAKEKSLLISAMIVKNKRGGCMQDDEQDILRQMLICVENRPTLPHKLHRELTHV